MRLMAVQLQRDFKLHSVRFPISVVYAFFDDGGAGPDADFDDMVVRITALDLSCGGETSPNPIPAALPLFATGLGVIGFLARRRKRKQST